jgi:hypothetical protein
VAESGCFGEDEDLGGGEKGSDRQDHVGSLSELGLEFLDWFWVLGFLPSRE